MELALICPIQSSPLSLLLLFLLLPLFRRLAITVSNNPRTIDSIMATDRQKPDPSASATGNLYQSVQAVDIHIRLWGSPMTTPRQWRIKDVTPERQEEIIVFMGMSLDKIRKVQDKTLI